MRSCLGPFQLIAILFLVQFPRPALSIPQKQLVHILREKGRSSSDSDESGLAEFCGSFRANIRMLEILVPLEIDILYKNQFFKSISFGKLCVALSYWVGLRPVPGWRS